MMLLMDVTVADDVAYCYTACAKACEHSPRGAECVDECKQQYCQNRQHCIDACCKDCEHKKPFFKMCLDKCLKQYCDGITDFTEVLDVGKPMKCRRRRA
ncbi:hypothetical protein MLD38_036991 [Melastoma candidum]|uniref:Uncharacterized protein n=1 Tax=Melastoma candidum TaxID=119954 RepID=A0ACB9LLN6_9MYRT|nr:hypothetical protein MLD38_036991 [Melastoma candidum]